MSDSRSAVNAGLSAAAGLGGGVTALATAADPFSTVPTFTASLKGVAIEAGQSLLPALDQVSMALQDFERFLERVDPQLKSFLGQWAVWGTLSAGAALAAIKLGAALWTVVKGVGALSLALATTPWGFVAVGVAAVSALAYSWLQAGDNAERAKRMFGLAGEQAARARPENAVAAADLGRLPADVRTKIEAAGGDREKVAAELNAYRDRTRKELEDARAAQVPQAIAGDRARRRFEELAEKEMPAVLESFWARLPAINRRGLGDKEHDDEIRWAAMMTSLDAQRRIRKAMAAEGIEIPAGEAQDAMTRLTVFKGLDEERYQEVFGREFHRANPYTDFMRLIGRPQFDFTPQSGPAAGIGVKRYEEESKRLKDAEDRARFAEDLARKTGASDRLTRDFQGPTPSIFSDPGQLADQIQLAALTAGDKTAENQTKQLEAAVKSGELLQQIHGAIEALRRDVQPRHLPAAPAGGGW